VKQDIKSDADESDDEKNTSTITEDARSLPSRDLLFSRNTSTKLDSLPSLTGMKRVPLNQIEKLSKMEVLTEPRQTSDPIVRELKSPGEDQDFDEVSHNYYVN